MQSLNEVAKQVVSDCAQNSKINPQHLDQLTGLITELVVIAEQKMPSTARHLEEAAKSANQSAASLPQALETQEDLLADYQSILERLRALMSRIEETSFAVRLQALCQQELNWLMRCEWSARQISASRQQSLGRVLFVGLDC